MNRAGIIVVFCYLCEIEVVGLGRVIAKEPLIKSFLVLVSILNWTTGISNCEIKMALPNVRMIDRIVSKLNLTKRFTHQF